jgi:prepilin-type N-terminal cleavage/methylation domain-containing protein
MTKQRGFTLIELLVVIAIIGVLSAVVLASLNTARSKGSDAAIMADLDGVRTQAQLYYGEHADSYGVAGTAEPSCAAADNVGNLFEDAIVSRQVTAADTANGLLSAACNVAADGTAYAAAAEFVTTPGTYYCIDSTGTSTTTATALIAGATVCS